MRFSGPSAERIGDSGTSLAAQWLRLSASAAGGMGSILAGELRSCIPRRATPNRSQKHRALCLLLQVVSIQCYVPACMGGGLRREGHRCMYG